MAEKDNFLIWGILIILGISLIFCTRALFAMDLTIDPNLAVVEKTTELENCTVVEGWIPSIKEDTRGPKIHFKEYWYNDGRMVRKYFNNEEKKSIGEFAFRFQPEMKDELYCVDSLPGEYAHPRMPKTEYVSRFAPWLLGDYAHRCGGSVWKDYRARYCPWK